MDRDKQVGLILIGNLRTTIQFDEGIGLASINDLHTGTVLFYQSSEGQGILQCQVFLLYPSLADCTRVTTTMSGINHQREVLGIHDTDRKEQPYTYYYIS